MTVEPKSVHTIHQRTRLPLRGVRGTWDVPSGKASGVADISCPVILSEIRRNGRSRRICGCSVVVLQLDKDDSFIILTIDINAAARAIRSAQDDKGECRYSRSSTTPRTKTCPWGRRY